MKNVKSEIRNPRTELGDLARRVLGVGLLALAAAVPVLVWSGCAATKPPTGVERYFFDVQTNLVAKVQVITNTVTLVQTNVVVQQVTLTNEVGVVVPVYVTNAVPFTNYYNVPVLVTNVVPQVTLATGTNAAVVASLAGTLSNLGLPGVGSLVTMGLLGLAASWAGYRNRQYAEQKAALEQTSGVLAQNIATFMEVLKKTPQGQQLLPVLQNYLTTHQAEAGVIAEVAGLLSQVDPLQAAGAAAQILAAVGELQAKAAPAAK